MLADDEFFEEFEIIENELADQYVHRRLSDADRGLFEKYLMQTPQQRQKLHFATALNEATIEHVRSKQEVAQFKPRPPAPVQFPAYLKIAALVIVAAGLAIALWLLLRKSEVERGMLALSQAYRNERIVESRISEINYSPLRPTRSAEPPKIDDLARSQAELLLTEAVDKSGDATSKHALGRVYLAGKQFDQARQQLEQALKLDANNAQLNSDMAAALLELGKLERTSDEVKAANTFRQSLQHLERALELDKSLPEALFNRGLLLEQMNLSSQAEEAWKRYLQNDSTTQWADEARRNLESVQQQNRETPQQRPDD